MLIFICFDIYRGFSKKWLIMASLSQKFCLCGFEIISRYFIHPASDHGCLDRRSVGPEFRTDIFGPVRRSEIPDRYFLVRSGGPEFWIKVGPETIIWSGPYFKRILYGPQKIKNYDQFSFHGTSCDEKMNLVNKLFPKVVFSILKVSKN